MCHLELFVAECSWSRIVSLEDIALSMISDTRRVYNLTPLIHSFFS